MGAGGAGAGAGGGGAGAALRRLARGLSYSTAREVQIDSWRLGLLYWALVAALLAYESFAIYSGGGYQAVSAVVGSVDAKVKGQAWSFGGQGGPHAPRRMWDATDITRLQPFGTFVATRLETIVQRQGTNSSTGETITCVGSHSSERCTGAPGVCVAGKVTWNGVMAASGEAGCRNSTLEPGEQYCLVQGWCETEDHDTSTQLEGTDDLSLFLRTNAKFPKFRNEGGEVYHWTNTNGTVLTPGWNVFTLQDLASLAGVADFESLRADGADIVVTLDFDCNLDGLGSSADIPTDRCQPVHPFPAFRIDSYTTLSKGYNIREEESISKIDLSPSFGPGRFYEERRITKLFGVRLRFQLMGSGRRYDTQTLVLHIGSALALLGVARVLADFLMLYVLPDRREYSELKVLQAHAGHEAEHGFLGGGADVRGLRGTLLPAPLPGA